MTKQWLFTDSNLSAILSCDISYHNELKPADLNAHYKLLFKLGIFDEDDVFRKIIIHFFSTNEFTASGILNGNRFKAMDNLKIVIQDEFTDAQRKIIDHVIKEFFVKLIESKCSISLDSLLFYMDKILSFSNKEIDFFRIFLEALLKESKIEILYSEEENEELLDILQDYSDECKDKKIVTLLAAICEKLQRENEMKILDAIPTLYIH